MRMTYIFSYTMKMNHRKWILKLALYFARVSTSLDFALRVSCRLTKWFEKLILMAMAKSTTKASQSCKIGYRSRIGLLWFSKTNLSSDISSQIKSNTRKYCLLMQKGPHVFAMSIRKTETLCELRCSQFTSTLKLL